MPISPIGSERTAPDAGFSLVEAMTTLFIAGLMASAVFLLAPGPDRETEALAERFAARIAMASEESIIANRPVALVVTREGHGFARLEQEGWRPVDSASPLAFRSWPADVDYEIAGQADGMESESGRVVRFDSLGGATPARILLVRAGSQWEVAVDGQGGAHVAKTR